MLFNSIGFIIFFPIVFILYWFVFQKKRKYQNVLLLVSSYYFYSCWDYRFLFLLIFSTLLDYYTGLKINNSDKRIGKIWLWISIIINVGFLGVFKYYNFFITSFSQLLSNLGFESNVWTLNVILPVGISFYTFHGLSYVLDIYKEKIKPEKNFIDYSLFVSFFPLLVAGPIERATHLLPQIKVNRVFDYQKAVDGLRQILWGFFKKIVIADNCAEYANLIFQNYNDYSGSTLFLGAIFFSIQIYCDFSGYSDIALGISRLLGIELLRNFAFPYFSRDIAEFWRRWHISLTTWFRDYVYIPLGGSKGTILRTIINVYIIFILSGFWHGANWTFIAWGFINATYFLPLLLFKRNRNHIDNVAEGRLLPSLKDFLKISITFILTAFAWIFFRSESVYDAIKYCQNIFNLSFFSIPEIRPRNLFILIIFFFSIEWIGRQNEFALKTFGFAWKRPFRALFYYAILISIIYFSYNEEGQQFIYFQF